MRNFEFIGITDGIPIVEKEKLPLPNNAIEITNYLDDTDLINCTIFTAPIIICILIILILIIKKYNILNYLKIYLEKQSLKYETLKKWQSILKIELKILSFSIILAIFILILSTIFHESIHAIFELIFDKKIKIGFDISSMIGYVESASSLYSKSQKIIILIMPFIIMGILPIIISFILLKKIKNKLIIVIIILFSCINISMCCSDFVNIYNYIHYVPNNALIQNFENEVYYLPNNQY